MSSDIAISVEGLGKCYHLYERPSDRLKQAIFRGRRKLFREFWALRDVSFDVARGECLGIVGRNGAGKSTLLQVLSGTLAQSVGNFRLHGRVAALLELGSGFNPEFTGRENVFLNAAILGIDERETTARYDEIVAFADIGDFIDQPVKTYSSGMMVRLAFAVASHVEPDTLIVDEALAVGDFAFQHKCIAKFRQIRERGTTVLFVTHDIGAVLANCERALWLTNGAVAALGSARDVCDRYLESATTARPATERHGTEESSDRIAEQAGGVVGLPMGVEVAPSFRWGSGEVRIRKWALTGMDGQHRDAFRFRDRMRISMVLEADRDVGPCFPGFVLRDRNGYYLTGITNRTCGRELRSLHAGDLVLLTFEVELLFKADNYSILLNVCADEFGTHFLDVCENVGNFSILDEPSQRPPWGYGRVYMPTTLTVTMLDTRGLTAQLGGGRSLA